MTHWRLLTFGYISIGFMVFGGQVVIRYGSCSLPSSCAISLAKAVVWTIIWPVYLWIASPSKFVAAVNFGGITTLIFVFIVALGFWAFRPIDQAEREHHDTDRKNTWC